MGTASPGARGILRAIMKRTINGRAWQGDAEALDALERSLTETKKRRESVSPEELDGALETITNYLETGWSTGGGRRLRQFVWSLWNGHHLINLFDLSSGLDNRLTDASIIVFRAAMLDALGEQQKRGVLEKSGEFARWEAARAATPEDEQVMYPPLQLDAEDLRKLAYSAEQCAKRSEQERRAEEARITAQERGCRV